MRQPPIFLPGFGAWVAFGEKEGLTPWDSAISRGLLWLSGYYMLALFALPYLARPQIPPRLRYPLLALLVWPRVLFSTPLTGLFYLLMAAESLGLSGLRRLDGLVVWQRERDPRTAGVFVMEGYDYLVKAGREAEAQSWLGRMAAALDGGEGLGLQYLMAHLVYSAQPQAALALFEERYQSRMGPLSLPLLCNNIAWGYHITGRSLRGLEYARQAVAREPANPSFLDTLGQILVEAGEGAEAEPTLRRALGLKQQLCSQVALSRALAAQGQFAEAVHLGRQALRQHTGPWPDQGLPPQERVTAWLAEWEALVSGSIPAASGID